MLVLTRSVGQQIRVANEIEIKVLEITGKKVRLGITAPHDTPVHREEVYRRLEQEACLSHAPESLRSCDDADRHQEVVVQELQAKDKDHDRDDPSGHAHQREVTSELLSVMT